MAMPDAQVPVATDNDVAEMDVDIIIARTTDTVNIQQEQFEILAKLAEARPEVKFSTLLKLSGLRTEVKKLVEDDITGANDPAAQAMAQQQQQFQQMMQQLQLVITQAEARAKMAQAAKDEAAAKETEVDSAVKVAQFISQPAAPQTQVRVS
jgi:hypothetical protein